MIIWDVTFSENGWEYTGHMYIPANSVTQVDYRTILADGVLIRLEEDIGEISKTKITNLQDI